LSTFLVGHQQTNTMWRHRYTIHVPHACFYAVIFEDTVIKYQTLAVRVARPNKTILSDLGG